MQMKHGGKLYTLVIILIFLLGAFVSYLMNNSQNDLQQMNGLRDTIYVPGDTIYKESVATVYHKLDTIFLAGNSKQNDYYEIETNATDTLRRIEVVDLGNCPPFVAMDTMITNYGVTYSEFHSPEMIFKIRQEFSADTVFVEFDCPEIEKTFFEEAWDTYGIATFVGVTSYAILMSFSND